MRTTVKLRARLQRGIGSVLLLVATMAHADPPPPRVEKDDPKVRFQHGVDLFRDGDYRAAVIEFRRAYELSPNPRVLYNLGEASLEAQDYPAAQSALRRYLDEVGKDVPPARRTQVEVDLRKLDARIAKIMIRSNVDDAEISIDDVPVGHTPLSAPLVVGAGRRRIVLSALGVQQSRIVDLAGGDNTTIDLPISSGRDTTGKDAIAPTSHDAAPVGSEPPRLERGARPSSSPPATRPSPGLSTAQTAGIVTTGVLAAGAGVMGALALVAKGEFDGKLENRPSTKVEIDSVRTRTRNLALTTDIVGGVALIVGTATLISIVLTSGERSGGERGGKIGLSVKPTGFELEGSF